MPMFNSNEILDTIHMIDQQHLDVRTITMGISLLSCAHSDVNTACDKIYDKITKYAEKLVQTGEDIEKEFGIPIVNKRISVTPIALVAAAAETENYTPFALALDRAAKVCGVNFIGGFSALVHKGMTEGDKKLIAAIPEALAVTDVVCSSVNVGSTKAGINMDAVALMGRTIKALARKWHKDATTTCHCNGGSYIRSCYAHEPARMEVCLLAMQGLGAPGRNFMKFIEWNIYENRMIDLMGTSPELNIPVYNALKKQVEDDDTVNRLAEDGYYLYDDAVMAVDLATKAEAMGASTAQLAMMGATIAADGMNPATKKTVFDGEIAKYIVALMAAKGPHKMNGPWLVSTGLPAKAGFGGTILGVYPGVMAVSAYGAELNPAGVSIKAARAIKHIMEKLDMSVFSSARVSIVKD